MVGIMTVLPLPGSINSNRWWETRSRNLRHFHYCCPSSTSSLSLVLIPRPRPTSSVSFDCCVFVVFVVIVFIVHRPHPSLPRYPHHHFPHHLVPHHSFSSSSSHILVASIVAVFGVVVASCLHHLPHPPYAHPHHLLSS